MFKVIASLSGIFFFFYLVFLGYAYFFQHRLVYVPYSSLQGDPAQIGLGFQEVYIDSRNGNRVHAWFIPAAQERAVVLFCHGNAGNISHRLQTISYLHSLDVSVLIFDYQGYGRSSGKPSEINTYADARAAWDYLVGTRRIDPDRIFIFGRSLGGAVAADLAAKTDPAGVILESTFTSVIDLGSELFRFLPVRLLSRFEYNTLDKLRNISAPTLIIHSPDDEIIPHSHGQRLYESATEPKHFQEIRGGHNTGFMESEVSYLESLDDFFSRYSPDGGP
ncbi:alpha/beta hydrolase [Desulfonatronovibrio hydrogenovorans]|uniref:alpha/beta hydrolase n=1 Tax=Desulfonatronovibrio hydrogenovorans TaxID=53245 RepID=UPI000490B341|nr:alpha/beta fold hydrolase [Desulfonatronovibrio hydrogenovorans]